MQLRIILYNAINPEQSSERTFRPLGFGYLVSAVRKFLPGLDVRFKFVEEGLRQAVEEFEPHIVGISSASKNYNFAMSAARTASQAGKPVIIGGPHV